jgi:hypothetical protein
MTSSFSTKNPVRVRRLEKPGRPCLGRRGRPQTMRGGVREGVRSSGVERSAHDLTERRRSRSVLSTAVVLARALGVPTREVKNS